MPLARPCRPRLFHRLLSACGVLLLTACSTLNSLNLYSDAELEPLSVQAYDEATKETKGLVTSGKDFEMVQRVAKKIAAVAEEEGFAWEARLLKADDVPNAFCLPNGRIAVYTGILPLTQNENGLAVVMGHEVAHAILRHGGKRMTSGMLTGGALQAVQAGLGLTQMSPEAKGGVMAVLGIGGQLGTLKFSRDHETEADVLGLRYAIRAGYDPNEAPKLWERMAALGGSTPVWLSTHPASTDRAENLRRLIPQLQAEEANWRPKAAASGSGAGGTQGAPAKASATPSQPATKR
ncbi:MAG: M48 family metallopeptidase [Planctomycetes bacterium]|nr:M48 family metallopeptidase [Planctomycetota bacterium]